MSFGEKEFFDNIADKFDSKYNAYSRLAGRQRIKNRIELFNKHCEFRHGLKVLELGCGTGAYTRELVKYDCALFCSDISHNMIRKVREKGLSQSNLCCVIADMIELPFRDNSIDIIVGNSILHHLDINRVIPQIFRVLKKNGRFAFSEPNMINPQVFLQKNIRFLKKLAGDSPNETAFFRWDLETVFKQNGFASISVKPFDFLHPSIPDFLVKGFNKLGGILEKIIFVKEIAGSLLITGVK